MRAALVLLAILVTAVRAEEPVRLTVLHTNDLHGQLRPLPPSPVRPVLRGKAAGGVAHLATLVEKHRAAAGEHGEAVLLLDAGDLFQGTPIGNETRGDAVVAVMNELRYDAVAVGNHEFDYGIENMIRLAKSSRAPWLAANLSRPGGDLTPVVSHVVLEPPRVPCRVALIGLISTQTPMMTAPVIGRTLRFADPAETLRALLPKIDAELIIVVSHLGLGEDRKLADAVPGIHLIVGGHSHSPAREMRNGVCIVQTHSRGMTLGKVELVFDRPSRKLLEARRELIEVDPAAIEPHAGVAAIIARYGKVLEEKMARVLGRLDAPLRRTRGLGSSTAGSWFCDVIREAGDAMIAFQNKGGIRCDLEKGEITAGDVYRIMPFENLVVSMDLKGSALRALVERHLAGSGYPGIEWSGMRVEAIRVGERLVPVRIEVAGRLLEEDAVYRVATNSFLAWGGDGFVEFREGENRTNSGQALRDLLAADLARRSPFAPTPTERLVLPADPR